MMLSPHTLKKITWIKKSNGPRTAQQHTAGDPNFVCVCVCAYRAYHIILKSRHVNENIKIER